MTIRVGCFALGEANTCRFNVVFVVMRMVQLLGSVIVIVQLCVGYKLCLLDRG